MRRQTQAAVRSGVMGRLRGACVGLVVAAVGLPAAGADVKPVAPYCVVVTRDGAPMKCSDNGNFYNVRVLKAGDTLRIDGEGEGGAWLRAEYLPGMQAYVVARDAKLDGEGKTLRLTQPSTLMAANAGGIRPWWPLMASNTPAGTTFSDASPVKAADGSVEGYLVPAPAQARGFVRSDAVRPATADEAAAYAAHTPAPAALPEVEGQTSVQQPVAENPFETSGGAKPTVAVQRPKTSSPPPLTKRIADVEPLKALFERAMQSGVDESELDTVVKEFQRTIAGFGATPEDVRIRAELNKRLDAIKLKRETIEARRKAQDASQAFDQRARSVRLALTEVEKQAVYTIVGTMIPSTVYDGKRGMPFMLRIESPDITSTRTIGYVVPRPGLDLIGKTGQVVGIVGDSMLDPALGVNIVSPVRVDILKYQEGRYQVESSQSVGSAKPPMPAPGNEGRDQSDGK